MARRKHSRPSAGTNRIRFKGQGVAPNLSSRSRSPPRNRPRFDACARFVNRRSRTRAFPPKVPPRSVRRVLRLGGVVKVGSARLSRPWCSALASAEVAGLLRRDQAYLLPGRVRDGVARRFGQALGGIAGQRTEDRIELLRIGGLRLVSDDIVILLEDLSDDRTNLVPLFARQAVPVGIIDFDVLVIPVSAAGPPKKYIT
jgi:hypothetical protein